MNEWKNRMLAVVAMLAAGGAHAASGVLDFDGYTVHYTSSGQWDGLPTYSQTTDQYRDYGRDAYTGQEYTLASGVDVNFGQAAFGSPTPLDIGSHGTLHSSFTYTIAAKPGWQLGQVSVSQYLEGTYLQTGGGAVVVDSQGSGSAQGGEVYTVHDASLTPEVVLPSHTAGTWYATSLQSGRGNDLVWDILYTSDGRDKTGYQFTWGISERNITHDFDPLTSLGASFSQTLSASTADGSWLHYNEGVYGQFFLSATALRNVSPVPEPDTYVLVAASLGVLGGLARRRAGRAA